MSRDDRFFDPESLAERYSDVSWRRTTVELGTEEWHAAHSRTAHGEWGVGALVIEDGRVLLIRQHREGDDEIWAAPGGMLEPGETHAEGAVREVEEETGLDVELDGLAAINEETCVNEAHPDQVFEFRFAMFAATPRTTTLAADPGLEGEDIRAVEWFESLPADTYQREFLVLLREQGRNPS